MEIREKNIKNILENYNIYKVRISIAEEKKQQLKNEMYDIKSSKIDGLPRAQGYTTSRLEEVVIKTRGRNRSKTEIHRYFKCRT